MAQYTIADKREFFEKDAKYNIGVGIGHSINNAILWAIEHKLSLEEAFEISDKIFHYSQVKQDQEFKKFLELNQIQQWYDDLKAKTQEIIEAEHPTIHQGIDV